MLYSGALFGGVADGLLPNTPGQALFSIGAEAVGGPLLGKAITGLEGLAAASPLTSRLAQDVSTVAGRVGTSLGQTADNMIGNALDRFGFRLSAVESGPGPALAPGESGAGANAVDAATNSASVVYATATDSVWHATRVSAAARGILDNGIDPAFLNPNTRFGAAFYVAEQPETSLAEMAHYSVDPSTGIRFEVNQGALNVLDLTNPDIAATWGYSGGPITSATQQIGADAAAQGYNAIRYFSEAR